MFLLVLMFFPFDPFGKKLPLFLAQNDGQGGVWVLNNKQGFQDSAPYAHLESWLGQKADEYWDDNFDELQLV